MTDRQIIRQIGDNVRTARLNANLTQECLAELAGVHWQTVSYLENGRAPCSIVTFTRIAQALAINPNRLLEGLPEPDLARMVAVRKAHARKRRPRQPKK